MDITKTLVDAAFDLLPQSAGPQIMTGICLVVGLVMTVNAVLSVRRGYMYLIWKWSFTEENRTYRESDPLFFWFGVITDGCIGVGALGMAIYGLFFFR